MPSGLAMYDDPEWLSKFRVYVREFLERIIPSNITKKTRKELFDKMTDQNNMRLWVSGVTHQSVNANNYESLEMSEYIGDRIMGSCFAYYLYTNFPNIEQGPATIIFNKYMKGESQTMWGRELGLHRWIQSYLDISDPDIEDAFEALFGVLLVVGNALIEGFGYVLTSNLLAQTIQYLQIDINNVEKDAKTIIKEFFTSMGWPDEHPFKPSDALVVRKPLADYDILEFHLTKKAISSIANAKGMTEASLTGVFARKQVETGGKDIAVFEEAYKKLRDMGYDMTKARDIPFSRIIQSKVASEGYQLLLLKEIKLKGTKNKLYQMIGERSRTENEINANLIKTYRDILRAVIVPEKTSREDVVKFLQNDYIKLGVSPKPRTAYT